MLNGLEIIQKIVLIWDLGIIRVLLVLNARRHLKQDTFVNVKSIWIGSLLILYWSKFKNYFNQLAVVLKVSQIPFSADASSLHLLIW